jgi:hypothetical protein
MQLARHYSKALGNFGVAGLVPRKVAWTSEENLTSLAIASVVVLVFAFVRTLSGATMLRSRDSHDMCVFVGRIIEFTRNESDANIICYRFPAHVYFTHSPRFAIFWTNQWYGRRRNAIPIR